MVPEDLVERLSEIANRMGVSISNYATEALKQALRINSLNATLDEAVDAYRLVKIQQGAGGVHIPRSTLNQLLKELYKEEGDRLKKMWYEAGRWYGEYLNTKLGDDEALSFLEKDLLISWNLDEVEINNNGYEASIRYASFMMTDEMTELLLSYISGVMRALNYREENKDYLRGMATIKFIKMIEINKEQ
ncbi:MAG: hypothetical protein ACLFVP_09940 [Candidatus Bathyarchaeia archaeon]